MSIPDWLQYLTPEEQIEALKKELTGRDLVIADLNNHLRNQLVAGAMAGEVVRVSEHAHDGDRFLVDGARAIVKFVDYVMKEMKCGPNYEDVRLAEYTRRENEVTDRLHKWDNLFDQVRHQLTRLCDTEDLVKKIDDRWGTYSSGTCVVTPQGKGGNGWNPSN